MLRRAFLSLAPALLALAFLCGTPVTGVGGVGPGETALSAASSTTTTSASVGRGSLTDDADDIATNPSADEDDTPDDRLVRVATLVVWPDSAYAARILHASDRAGDRYRPCAARPRAPPIA